MMAARENIGIYAPSVRESELGTCHLMMIDDNNTYRNGINHPQVLVRAKARGNFKSKQIGKQTRPLKKKQKSVD